MSDFPAQTMEDHLAGILWRRSRNQLDLDIAMPPEAVARRLGAALAQSEEFQGKVVPAGYQIWRSRRYARSRNTFSPIFYGTITATEQGSRLAGHFQLNPVMRLFLIVWLSCTTLLALAVLAAGLLRATPESSAGDAVPYLLPALLPLLGWAILAWQQRRGRTDEEAIRQWVVAVLV